MSRSKASPTYPSDLHDKFMLRLPDDLRDRIKAQAARNRRSMNSEIVLAIESWLQNENAPVVAATEASKS